MPHLIALWDQAARRLMAIRPVAEGSVIGYVLRRYPGRSLTGADGVTLSHGERVVELHLDSRAIESRTAGASAHQRILFLRRELLAALREFARLARDDPRFADIRGLWALTVLNRGVDHLGFTVVPVPPSLTRWLASRYMKALLCAYHPDGAERLHQRAEVLEPAEIFLSREMLINRYGVNRQRKPGQPKVGLTE